MDSQETVEVQEAQFRSQLEHGRTNLHPSHWPPDVRQVSLEGLALLGLDSKGRLYLDGDPVYTARRWSTTERTIAIVGVAAALIGAISALVSAVSDVQAAKPLYTSDIEHVAIENGSKNNVPLDLIVTVHGKRADDAGAVGVSFPHPSASNQMMSAGGIPIHLGIKGLRPTADGYEVSGYLGNLSSAVVGGCTAEMVLSNGSSKIHSERVSFDGYFSPGTARDLALRLTTDYPDAKSATLSEVRCTGVYYVDAVTPKGTASE